MKSWLMISLRNLAKRHHSEDIMQFVCGVRTVHELNGELVNVVQGKEGTFLPMAHHPSRTLAVPVQEMCTSQAAMEKLFELAMKMAPESLDSFSAFNSAYNAI